MADTVRGFCRSCMELVDKQTAHLPSLRVYIFVCTNCGKVTFWHVGKPRITDKHNGGCIDCS